MTERKEVTIQFVGKALERLEECKLLDGSPSYAESVRKAVALYWWHLTDGAGCDLLLRRPDGTVERVVLIT